MADFFQFTGKIALGKDSDKFHPVQRNKYDSGWARTRVVFNCLSGTNRVMCTVDGGKWDKDEKNGAIKTFSKTVTNADGSVTKGEKIEIPWAKRFDVDQIARVAGFRKMVVDTGDIGMRYKLQDAITAFENDEITDELIEQIGVDNIEDAKAALKKNEAKKKEFLNAWDFAEYVVKLLQSDKYKDKLFNVSGNYEVAYNPEKDKYYTSYAVNRITLAKEDAEPKTDFKIDFFFGEDAFDDEDYEETGKAHVSGYVQYYDNNVKANGFMPLVVTVKETEKKKDALKRKFSTAEDDQIKMIGLTLTCVEGAERVELTEDMLSEEQREDLELGLVSWDELKRALGGSVVGDRVSELRFKELAANKSSAQETSFTTEDMVPAKAKVEEDEDEEDDDSVPFDLTDDDDL